MKKIVLRMEFNLKQIYYDNKLSSKWDISHKL